MFTIKVKGNIISVQETEPITSGSVSVYKCQFIFDNSWEGFFRSAVFRCGSMVKTVPLDAENMCDLPWELLEKKHIGLPVEVSIYGSKGETEILPTIWDKLGRVRKGSEPGEDVKAPTPSVYDQLTNIVRVYAEKVAADIDTVVESAKEAETAAEAAAETVAQIGTAVTDTQTAARSAEESRLAAESAASTAVASAEASTAASESAVTASAQAAQSESNAASHASSAQESAERAAEAEAVAESAISSAGEAVAAAETATEQAAVSSNAATIAIAAASNAAQSESHAKQSADEAEAWSKKAEQAAGGGVLSFKGRGGAVTPESGDYTAEMVGADASGSAAQALSDAKAYTDEKIADIPAPKETDPTVPAWAKEASKPAYTASEVGAFGHLSGGGSFTGDLNDFVDFGSALICSDVANRPSGTSIYGTVWNIFGNDYAGYLAQYYVNAANRRMYVRHRIDGTWNTWSELLHTGNMDLITPSGIGAAASSHTHSTSDISGLTALLGSGAKIQMGSYTGTGTYGSSNPCSLTFSFVPKMVVVMKSDEIAPAKATSSANVLGFVWVGQTGIDSTYGEKFSLSGNTFSWYNTSSQANQLNHSSYTYYWVAIG